MPTYQYACTTDGCGNEFELVQSFTDPAASECPVCEGPVRKVFSAVGVVFKGSGFYRTDSRAASSSSTVPSTSESKSESKSESSSESKSESKSASASSSNSSSSRSSSSSTAAPAAASA